MKIAIKTLLFESLSTALIGILVWLPVFGADTGTINASVTASNAAISVTDGSVAYGTVAWSGTSDTTTGQTQTATNDGSTATFNIKSSQATGGTGWTMAGAIGTIDQFVHQFSTTTVPTWVTFDANPSTYKTATTSVANGLNHDIDLKITVPYETTDFTPKSITVTVQAVAE